MSDMGVIDFRSDTVTRPTRGMMEAIMAATLGDDVLGDDPTVLALQSKVAGLLGKEAALFVPSGSMANQIAIRCQTSHGDEVIAHKDSHIYHYESGAPAALSGCSLRLLEGDRGQFSAEAVTTGIRPPDSHYPRSSLVLIENTQNRGGGSVWSLDRIAEIRKAAAAGGLGMHLDGARLMNACVATGHAPAEYARHFDTVSMCFSKGLGAPVGSALAGSAALIGRAHRFRKMFGGGMRQSGLLAAAAIYALDHHVTRLADDHNLATKLAREVASLPELQIDVNAVETNMVFFDIGLQGATADWLCRNLREYGIRMMPVAAQRIRAVAHLDIPADGVERTAAALRLILKKRRAA